MKKAGAVLAIVVLITVLSTSLCFAAGGSTFKLEESYPADGSTGASMENLGVKLYFNTKMSSDVLGSANDDAFTLTDADGEDLPLRILYSEKEEGVILVLLDSTYDADGDGTSDAPSVLSNSEYKLTISADLVDDKGNTLGDETVVTFTTINQSRNSTVSMVMMIVMFGGMMFFSMRSNQRNNEDNNNGKKDDKVNPYKEAKKTGKSVEEIVEKDQKEKAKKAAREAAKAAKEDQYEWIDINTYRVKAPRPISEGGSTYVTGRKAIADAKKAEEAAKKAAKQQQASKQNSKVKKGQGKKKK